MSEEQAQETKLTTQQQLGAVCLALLGLVAIVMLHGYVLTWLRQWFVVPIFGIRIIGVAEGIGLAASVRFMLLQHRSHNTKTDGFLERVFLPLFVWGLCYVVHLWV